MIKIMNEDVNIKSYEDMLEFKSRFESSEFCRQNEDIIDEMIEKLYDVIEEDRKDAVDAYNEYVIEDLDSYDSEGEFNELDDSELSVFYYDYLLSTPPEYVIENELTRYLVSKLDCLGNSLEDCVDEIVAYANLLYFEEDFLLETESPLEPGEVESERDERAYDNYVDWYVHAKKNGDFDY